MFVPAQVPFTAPSGVMYLAHRPAKALRATTMSSAGSQPRFAPRAIA